MRDRATLPGTMHPLAALILDKLSAVLTYHMKDLREAIGQAITHVLAACKGPLFGLMLKYEKDRVCVCVCGSVSYHFMRIRSASLLYMLCLMIHDYVIGRVLRLLRSFRTCGMHIRIVVSLRTSN